MDDHYRIQELLETKPFEALTEEEKTAVLQEITREEYSSRHSLLQSMKQFLQEPNRALQPAPAARLAALALLQERKPARVLPLWKRVGTVRIPAYAAAAVLLLVAGLLFYFNKDTSSSTKPSLALAPKTIYKTDTLVVEKRVPEYVSVPVIRYVETVPRTATAGISYTGGLPETHSLPQGLAPGGFSFSQDQLNRQLNSNSRDNHEQEKLSGLLVISN